VKEYKKKQFKGTIIMGNDLIELALIKQERPGTSALALNWLVGPKC